MFGEQYLPRFVKDPMFWDLLDELGSYHEDLNFQRKAQTGAEASKKRAQQKSQPTRSVHLDDVHEQIIDADVLAHLTLANKSTSLALLAASSLQPTRLPCSASSDGASAPVVR